MKTYLVTATPKFAPWNGGQYTTEVRANNAKEAVSRARRQVALDCIFSRQDGAISYRAEPTNGS